VKLKRQRDIHDPKNATEGRASRPGEIVLASSADSRDAHKELYHFTDSVYFMSGKDLVEAIAELSGDHNRIHISSPWKDMVRLAVWKSEPGKGDVFLLLMNAGITAEELRPFRDSEISDLFPWLYYGNRLDVLRKICRTAKANVEKNIGGRETHVYCHLTSEATKRIVASSL
jgi:hypothetical protein